VCLWYDLCRNCSWMILCLPAVLWGAPVSYIASEAGNPDQNVTWACCWMWTDQFEQIDAWPCSFSVCGRRPIARYVHRGHLDIRCHSWYSERSCDWSVWSTAMQKGNILVSIQLVSTCVRANWHYNCCHRFMYIKYPIITVYHASCCPPQCHVLV